MQKAFADALKVNSQGEDKAQQARVFADQSIVAYESLLYQLIKRISKLEEKKIQSISAESNEKS